jgi:hypothetical protein
MKLNRTAYSLALSCLALAILALPGCGDDTGTDAATGASESGAAASALPEALFLSQAPDGIVDIQSLKASAKEGDEVVVRVVVGGTTDPIVAGRASAAIIDASVDNPCLSEDDHCPIPWDYCCTPQENRTANLATLRITDDTGSVLKAELTTRIKPLTTLVIAGTVGPRPDEQVLTIDAQGIYIESEVQ